MLIFLTARRRFLIALLAAAVAAAPIGSRADQVALPEPPTTSADAGTILLPAGTPVVVSLGETVSSATATVDDQIGIVVKKAVVMGGMVVVPLGAGGHATVTSVEHAGSNGSGGKLALSVDWVYSADGGKIKLSQTNHASENGDSKGAASTATIASYLLLGPLGLFAHNFVRGRDVTIDTKKTFTVFVDGDVHVQSNQRPQQDPGFEH